MGRWSDVFEEGAVGGHAWNLRATVWDMWSATSRHWNCRFSSCTVRVSPTDEDDVDNCFGISIMAESAFRVRCIAYRAAIVNSQTLEEVARLEKDIIQEFEYGHKVNRGEVWIATHKHANGEFVNDKAKEIGEKIEAYESSGSISKDISSEDSLAKGLGSEEHCGRVRGLGLGPCPTRVFGHTVRSYNGITSSSTSYRQLQNQGLAQLLEMQFPGV
ncbi:hypothetical protein VNO78_16091 [Psophocarpus tetragonolobus]|uniref:Uncharacterized protein n=1 Tax=Psophocarpus tetragonolobus TaxID=3891 RepID=A0AAN9XKG7_PSOTE